MHKDRYPDSNPMKFQIPQTANSNIKNYAKLAPRDVFTLKSALKMRQFSRASWFEPKHTIESIQDQSLEHHLITI